MAHKSGIYAYTQTQVLEVLREVQMYILQKCDVVIYAQYYSDNTERRSAD